jgi:hypothetical protein
MARQNRVTPFGGIVATPERGTFMGNRGVLHDEDGNIRRTWQLRRWLLCVLEFRGRQRTLMALGRYTELFFLDEATGLAAGHRPCFECRRQRFLAFQHAWSSRHPQGRSSLPATAAAMDDRLHAERLGLGRCQQTFPGRIGDLPDGVMVQRLDSPGAAHLIWKGRLHLWSSGGYLKTASPRNDEEVLVLTPKASVATIQAGYLPEVHPSARRQ